MTTELERLAALFPAAGREAVGDPMKELALQVLGPLFERNAEELRELARRCDLARARAIISDLGLLREAELLDCLRRLAWAVRNLR